MTRIVSACVLSLLVASIAVASTSCIVIDTAGEFLNSQFVLLHAKLSPGSTAPLQGYFAQFDPILLTFINFSPFSGQSIVNHAGSNAALGMVVYHTDVSANGGGSAALPGSNVQLVCGPAQGSKSIVKGGMCFGAVDSTVIDAHFTPCGSATNIP
jgi:hypothetical protein